MNKRIRNNKNPKSSLKPVKLELRRILWFHIERANGRRYYVDWETIFKTGIPFGLCGRVPRTYSFFTRNA